MAETFESPYRPLALEAWAEKNDVVTVPGLFRFAMANGAGPSRHLGAKIDGRYRYQTYNETQTDIHQLAAALIEKGLEPTDRVGIWSENCPQWAISDFGIAHAGCVSVPLYPTLSGPAIVALLQDSGARLVICNSSDHLRSLISLESQVANLDIIVTIGLETLEGYSSSKQLYTWKDCLALGKASLDRRKEEMERRIAALKATDVASIIYTSGTTGEPKGAMLMHGNLVSNAINSNRTGIKKGDLELSFLPLSHVFERIVSYTLTRVGATIAYAESLEKLMGNLVEVRPTLMASVPRLFEKIHSRITQGVAAAPMARRAIFAWALRVGMARHLALGQGKLRRYQQLQFEMAHKLVLGKIQAALGGRIRFLISGGAPLRGEIFDFFSGAGFRLLEGYGLTETSPTLTSNPTQNPLAATVGTPIADTDVRIAADGEVIARGPQVMLGYYHKLEATAEAIDSDGYFHTGDIGEFTADGYLKITDRKKDLLVMSNGKNVAPQPIEHRLSASPLIEQAVVVGDAQKFIAALIYPAYPQLQGWLKEQGITDSPAELPKNAKLLEHMQKEVDRCCEGLSNYELVKKIAILPAELSMAAGELTPTLKVKRKVVTAKNAAALAALYA